MLSMSLPDMLKKYGATRILLHYGGGSVKNNGVYDAIARRLSAGGFEFLELGGVHPNPVSR
jgi:alcohol dehydrogenase YqhD (iron-dependent ADH family)